MFEIKEKEQLASVIFQMVIFAPRVAKKALPGQFIILRIDEGGERMPLTVSWQFSSMIMSFWNIAHAMKRHYIRSKKL